MAQGEAIHDAVRTSNLEVMWEQIGAGHINDQEEFTSKTPLMIATLAGYPDVVRDLLVNGANTTILDKNGYTPIEASAFKGFVEITEMLLVYQPELATFVNPGDRLTPLHRCAWHHSPSHLSVATLLLSHGANANALEPSASEATPLHGASNRGHEEMVLLLLRAQANPNAINVEKQTPLHLASLSAHTGVVKLLLEWGSDATYRDLAGKSPRDLAPQSGVKRLETSIFDGFDDGIDSESTVAIKTRAQLEDEEELRYVLETMRRLESEGRGEGADDPEEKDELREKVTEAMRRTTGHTEL